MINYLPLYILLILICLLGLVALAFSQDRVKKVLCLSFIYINFTILIIVISTSVNKQNQIFEALAAIIFLFSVNLIVGFSLLKKEIPINESEIKS